MRWIGDRLMDGWMMLSSSLSSCLCYILSPPDNDDNNNDDDDDYDDDRWEASVTISSRPRPATPAYVLSRMETFSSTSI